MLDKIFIPPSSIWTEREDIQKEHSERTELQDEVSLPWSVQKNRSLEHFDCFPPINKS